MSTIRSVTALLALLTLAACGDSTSPGADTLEVELRNFTNSAAVMGEVDTPDGSLVAVAGNPTTGNPTNITVVDPGVGNDVTFRAAWSTMADTISCTVTSATAVSVPPGVVIQAFGGLSCVDW